MANKIMEDKDYKNFKTSRGINYHYYRVQAQEGRPTLFFCHGFPSTSYDWRHQVAFFKPLGYGIVAPDMLGYGGSDRPSDTDQYRYPLQTKDLDELLEHEGLSKVILIAHDWGSALATHMIIRIPQRFAGIVFLAVGFMAPNQKFEAKVLNQVMKEQLGFSLFGYQEFFLEEGADKIIAEHYESFDSVIYPEDPEIWKDVMRPVGAIKEFVASNKIAPPASYVTNEEREHLKSILLKDDIRGGLQWYKVASTGYDDSLDIPKSQYDIQQPTLFVGALKDYVCMAEHMKQGTAQYAKKFKAIELDTSHWVQLEKPNELNDEIQTWLAENGL